MGTKNDTCTLTDGQTNSFRDKEQLDRQANSYIHLCRRTVRQRQTVGQRYNKLDRQIKSWLNRQTVGQTEEQLDRQIV